MVLGTDALVPSGSQVPVIHAEFLSGKKRGHIWDIMAYGCVRKMRIPIKLFFNAENDNYIRSITFWGTLFSDNPICVDHPKYIYIYTVDGMNQPYLLRATLGL